MKGSDAIGVTQCAILCTEQSTLDILFCQITTAFVLGLQTSLSIDFSKVYESKGLKAINKGHANFYECCDLTKKVYLTHKHHMRNAHSPANR